MSILLKILIATIITFIIVATIFCCLISGRISKREYKRFDESNCIKDSNQQ